MNTSPGSPSPGSPSPAPTLSALRERAIAALAPFFGEAPGGHETLARGLAADALDEYQALSARELQLAAQIVVLTWTSLTCLSAAITVRDESINRMLDLQDIALKLERSRQKMTKMLEACRKERALNPRATGGWDEGAFQLAVNRALEVFLDADGRVKAFTAKMSPPEAKAKKAFKLPLGFAEPMTPAVLARRARP